MYMREKGPAGGRGSSLCGFLAALLLAVILSSTSSLHAAENTHAVEVLSNSEIMLKQNPRNVQGQILHASALGDLKRFDEELIEGKRIVAKNPQLKNGYLIEEHAYSGLKQYDLALKALEHAFEIEAPDSDQLNLKATILAKSGKYKEAVNVYNQVLLLSPTNADAYALRGNCYYRLDGASERAIKDLEKSLSIDPSKATVRKLLEDLRGMHHQ